MHKSLIFFFQIPLTDLKTRLEIFSEDFDILLKDTFDDEELEVFAQKVDDLAAVYVQAISGELRFDDFISSSGESIAQEEFFKEVQSSLCFEHLPFLETNPFQVTYLLELLKRFQEVLIDRGGVFPLIFKDDFIKELLGYKTIDKLIPNRPPHLVRAISSFPIDPIDFLVRDVYDAFERIKDHAPSDEGLSLNVKQIYRLIQLGRLNPSDLFRKSGLNAKEFDDGLEQLKFWLRKH
jgi:hypothetical protein